MREEEISWLSWAADVVSTLPDMVAIDCGGVCCMCRRGGWKTWWGLAHPARLSDER